MTSNLRQKSCSALLLCLFSILIFSPAVILAQTHSDTTYTISFQVNMTKPILEGILNPDSGAVFVVVDDLAVMRLVPGPGQVYSIIIDEGLDSAATYHYKFRINDTILENVSRSVMAKPGITYVNVWWNDESLNSNTFLMDMGFMVQQGKFHPSADSLYLVGSMNNWLGSSPLQRVDTINYSYEITYTNLIPGTIHQYKFRINRDSAGFELQGKSNRMIRIMGGAQMDLHYFDNYNPTMQPMTFQCNMGYYIHAMHFNPLSDFIDVSGNFNQWGHGGMLFDADHDSIYSLETLIDTSFFLLPLEFKFRINGDSLNAELQGKPQRTYIFHDTTGIHPNLFNGWYDDKDPGVLTPPWVTDVSIQGTYINHQVLWGMYTYQNVNGIPEDSTTFKWYRSNDSLMIDMAPIDSALKIAYTVDTLDIGKWLVFEVTPRAAYGDSAVGKPVRVVTPSKIGGVGIEEMERIPVRVYPNPASDLITIESTRELTRLEVLNLMGQVTAAQLLPRSQKTTLNVTMLTPGIYLLKVYGVDSGFGMVKFLKR